VHPVEMQCNSQFTFQYT